MDNAKENEDLVEKMIRKRKEENDAFKKLLDNIKLRQTQHDERPQNNNPKPSTNNSIL